MAAQRPVAARLALQGHTHTHTHTHTRGQSTGVRGMAMHWITSLVFWSSPTCVCDPGRLFVYLAFVVVVVSRATMDLFQTTK